MKNSFKIISYLFCALFTLSVMAIDLPTRNDQNYVSPESIEGATTVDAEKAYELWKERALFVDVRKEGQFESGRNRRLRPVGRTTARKLQPGAGRKSIAAAGNRQSRNLSFYQTKYRRLLCLGLCNPL